MDAKKFLELQGQIQQNNQEYLSFVGELDAWKADLERQREKKSTTGRAEGAAASADDLPPVRNSLLKKKMKKKTKTKPKQQPESAEQQQGQQARQKISGYDYRAWDKFDVDKACEQVDKAKAVASKSSESEYETDEEWEEERRRGLAESKKQAGNDAFKAQRFSEAVEQYTKAAQLNPEEPVYYCNRAMAQLRLDRHAAAEADCDAALELDPKMVKAYYRRGQARLKLDKLPEALRDFEEALALEPSNRALQSEVAELRLRLHPERCATGEVKPIFDRPPAERSAKPLLRVPIQEVSAKAAAAVPAAPSRQQAEEPSTGRHEKSRSSQPEPSAAVVSGSSSSSASPAPAAAVAPPETPFQYKAAQRSLARRDPLAFCTGVLCAVDPDRLPALIGESLESDGLVDLAVAFAAGLAARPELAGRVLRCLRAVADRVKRFATCVAFLSAAERARVAELMRRLLTLALPSGEAEAAAVRQLAAAFGVGDCLEG